MDPNETAAQMVDAICRGDAQEARRLLGYLRDWIASGGFPPDMLTVLANLRRKVVMP